MTIGVLALQGDVREHITLIEALGKSAIGVKTKEDLAKVKGLIIPGGESTTISKLLVSFDLLVPVREFARTRPTLGTCAGLILLSDQVEGALPDQQLVGGLPIRVSRNAYGSQTQSFEAEVSFDGRAENVAFIRAPKILDAGDCQVLAIFEKEPVALRRGNLLGASFHPELTGSKVLHSMLLEAAYG